MDMSIVMQTMRDPAGVPAHPLLLQTLMVLTWTFHISFVHLTLGSIGVAIYSFYRRNQHPNWERLSIAMTQVAKISVSLLIVLGVAPLLFTQVLYDPQWYVSNLLSASWVIAFIFIMIVAYCLWFIFYQINHHGAQNYHGAYAWISLVLFLLSGLIMHTLAYQALLPEQWMNWYAPGGVVDTSGTLLHAISWPRYLFIISLAVPAVGLYLMAYVSYFTHRPDYAPAYLDFVHNIGQRLATAGFILSASLFLAWQAMNPNSAQIVGWVLVATMLTMSAWAWLFTSRGNGYWPLIGWIVVVATLSLWREMIRVQHLAAFGYVINDYKINLDGSSILLFFTTLIGVGGLVGSYYLTLLYQAGRTQGMYTASPNVARLGTAAIAVLIAWIAVFFTYGITIWLNNYFFS